MRPAIDPTSLGPRDLSLLHDIRRVRLLTGRQLERLHFAGLATPNARGSARRRSMNRLAERSLVVALPRRVGGERAGSAGLVYNLDAAGHRLLDAAGDHGRRRRPWAIGQMFALHTLAISELYVRLREAEARGDLRLVSFDAEPESWHHSTLGLIKPDAYAVIATAQWEEHLWVEVDRGTESLPTLRRKLSAYVELAGAGDTGPDGVLPRVLVTVETQKRLEDVRRLIAELPAPAADLITAEPFAEAFADGRTAPPPDGPRGPP